jgi:hypothetical protein
MKKLILVTMFISLLLGAAGCVVDGYVQTRPAEVVYVHPGAPGPDYVWINGDWVWGGGRYFWHEGHWDRPRAGRHYEGGHWEQGGRGWKWHHGGWR